MKKPKLFLFVLPCLIFVSCKKTYTCSCSFKKTVETTVTSGGITTTTYTVVEGQDPDFTIKDSRSEAERLCKAEGYTFNVSYSSGMPTMYDEKDCHLTD